MAPFEVLVKPMDLAYGLAEVLKVKMPKLCHGCDGLIFTSLHAPYEPGTTMDILKWKPPQENTIDFKLHLNFPPDLEADPSGETPDWKSKPRFQLLQHVSGDEHEFYDWLDMDDEEWNEWKIKSEQLDDRIVECSWHPPSPEGENVSTWHITRVRDDKTTANHKTTVSKIMESIRNGVMEEELIALVPEIRAAWKSEKRESYRGRIHKNQQPRRYPPNVKGLGGPGPPMRKGGMPNLKRR
ncbi:mRNA guanylyltransferase [Malassezia nana]|uniref:mRNA guanylyltransferase n=1 Tax=Malassezia nana TaxID=180528 RepID=A0AAF0ENU2_9BASI|nr:mRNA guanylyltransferase [Malassezia nana]